jgi:hypothetical protein
MDNVVSKISHSVAGGLWSCWQNNFAGWRNALSLFSVRQKLCNETVARRWIEGRKIHVTTPSTDLILHNLSDVSVAKVTQLQYRTETTIYTIWNEMIWYVLGLRLVLLEIIKKQCNVEAPCWVCEKSAHDSDLSLRMTLTSVPCVDICVCGKTLSFNA